MKWRWDYRFLTKVRIAVRRCGIVESGRQKVQGTDGSRWPTADSVETTNRPFPWARRRPSKPRPGDGRRTENRRGGALPPTPRLTRLGQDAGIS
jgi:hypothetical protein